MKQAILLACLCCASLCAAQSGVPAMGRTGGSSGGGSGPTLFTYVASSVTGCINQNATQTACQFTTHQTPGAGHLLVLFVDWIGVFGSQNMSITGTQTWTAIGSPKQGAGTLTSFQSQMFFVPSATAAATTITATISSGNTSFIMWEMAEYSYTGTLLTLDPANATGFTYSNTAAVAGTLTVNTSSNTTGTSDLLWAFCGAVDSACTSGAGYTARNDTNACEATNSAGGCTTGHSFAGDTGSVVQEKTGVTAGAQSATFGAGTTDNALYGLAAFGK